MVIVLVATTSSVAWASHTKDHELQLRDELKVMHDKNINTIYFKAILDNNSTLVKVLLSNGFDPNIYHSNGKTGLMMASSLGHIDMVKTLVSKKANINLLSKGLDKDRNSLYFAKKNAHENVVQYLRSMGAK